MVGLGGENMQESLLVGVGKVVGIKKQKLASLDSWCD